LKFKTVEISLPDRIAALDWIDSNQLGRRNLSPDQMRLLRGRLYNRMKKAQGGRADRDFSGGQNYHPKTAEKIAKQTGVTEKTVRRDAKFAEAVDKSPELAKAVMERKPVKQVQREIKEKAREKRRDENRKKVALVTAPKSLEVKYATILLDPPWDWGDEGDVNQLGRAKPDYSTMSIDELSNLPISDISDIDCHIYMWITNRSLPKGFRLFDAWGFRYITMLTWPKPSFGMGNYFRGQTEHILFGVKGSQMLARKNASTLLPSWSRGEGGHSSKPVEIYDFIESCSPGPYVELFGRSTRKGWFQWGENG
jgi:N6-adenosine-specific RNA methylase IME4